MTATLKVENLIVERQGSAVARDISFHAEPGKVLALLGPNGGGKTSLLEALAGVIPFAGGRATYDGEDLAKLSRTRRARAGLVLVEQGRTVFDSLTVAENLAVTGTAKPEDCFELFPELETRWTSASGLLSGGEQQMLVLARALACRPKVLMIDEMSLGLAPVIVRRLLPKVRALADSGLAVVLVEQFAALALEIADEAVVMASGRETFSGPASTLAGDPALLHRAYLGTSDRG